MYRSRRTRPHSPVRFQRLGAADIRHIVGTFHSSSPWKHAMSYDPLPLPFILFVIIARLCLCTVHGSPWLFANEPILWTFRSVVLHPRRRTLIKKRRSYLTCEDLSRYCLSELRTDFELLEDQKNFKLKNREKGNWRPSVIFIWR